MLTPRQQPRQQQPKQHERRKLQREKLHIHPQMLRPVYRRVAAERRGDKPAERQDELPAPADRQNRVPLHQKVHDPRRHDAQQNPADT